MQFSDSALKSPTLAAGYLMQDSNADVKPFSISIACCLESKFLVDGLESGLQHLSGQGILIKI